MAHMQGPHGPDLWSGRPLPAVEHISNDFSDLENSPRSTTTNFPQPPLRVLLSAGKGSDGRHLYSVHTLEAVSFSSTNTSRSTLIGDGPLYQLKSSPNLSSEGLIGRAEDDRNMDVLPPKRGTRSYRWLRWNFGSVYRRIFALSYVCNFITLAVLVIPNQTLGVGNGLSYGAALTAVSVNILALLLVRNEHVVNALFMVFGSWPRYAPLPLRRLFAKVYSYGGIHSACGVSATMWFLAYVVLVTRDFSGPDTPLIQGYILLASYLILFSLVAILVFAYPRLRVLIHNWFEGIHRFLGWFTILLFWFLTLMMAADDARVRKVPMAMTTAMSPSFWMLLISTLLVIYPWTHLRLRDVEAEVLSDHVVKLNFDYARVNYGQAVRLSDAPLRETHAFAVIPKSEPVRSGKNRPKGFSVLVSHAGDWTKKIIQNPPKRIWTRGLPQYGVLRVAGLFKPVIIIATGSGIGPCLSLFVQKPDHPVRIIWSTPKPEETYGQEVIDTILKADPQAVIIDTRKEGRPNLVEIAYRMYRGSHRAASGGFLPGSEKNVGPCEACVIISNQKVTKKVVYGLESRKVPAYGAIFDS
ncbi:hypothetical protein F4778DRAFT_613401 [Xylariomycetidae sp. FL2044]|nr:hypothetical protein F4778DRAFT_613401 [Xylariomycetidae sp. FL2044]